MSRRIVIIQGHPDINTSHLGHALATAYREGAQAAGHEVREVSVAALDFPLLRTAEDWNQGSVPPALQDVQEAIRWAEHLVIVFPLWAGTLPAVLKGFFEQVFRPGFAFRYVDHHETRADLHGRTARIVVTMGMPALAFRWFFGAHGVRCFKRNLLQFVGIRPVRTSYIGMVESRRFAAGKWFDRMRELGRRAR